jgi:hypothetical protein
MSTPSTDMINAIAGQLQVKFFKEKLQRDVFEDGLPAPQTIILKTS